MTLDIIGTPLYSFELSFDWCTDTGADGTTTFNVNANETGLLSGTSINLSNTGDQSNSTTWGSQDVNVTTADSGAVTELYVKGLTLTFTTSDTTYTYYITYTNVDNSCENQSVVSDFCIKNC